ncbi:MAG: DUF4157 domain-containing protein [Nitrospira sp.]|nr:DUF4157 domain-containing protein [Nitrospira sp.]
MSARAAATQTTVAAPLSITSVRSSLGLQRQCACGGSAGLTGACQDCQKKKLVGKPLQTKLRINEPGDQYEQEADRVAEQVMRMPETEISGPRGPSWSPLVQRRASGGGTGLMEAPPSVHEALSSQGQPLGADTRAFFEPRFGHDFSRVRVHTDGKADDSARAVNAHAYTVGTDIVFGNGQYISGPSKGRRLLAHELTHVMQQMGSEGNRSGESNEKRVLSPVIISTASTAFLQRFPDGGEGSAGSKTVAAPYPEESNVIAYAVGAQKLGKLAEGLVLFTSKDWKAAAMSPTAFYVGPFFSDMGSFYYVYRFTESDQKTSTYTLTRGTYLPAADDKDIQAGLKQVQGKTILQVKTSGLSPSPQGGSAAEDPKASTGTKDTGIKPGKDTGVQGGSDAPAIATDILPEFADKTVEQCREIVGDIYGGLNKEANSGILDHKLDAVNGMQTILDKSDPAVSSNVIFALSLVTNAAAGALGVALPKIAANAIIWGAAGAANGAVALFSNDDLIDAVEFCQKYMQSLRMSKDTAVKKVRSAIVGDVVQVRAAASAFRRMVQDSAQISYIKLNQEREVVDLWTNTLLAEKASKKGKKVGGPSDPGKVGIADYGFETEGRILLGGGRIEANPPPVENPFRWIKSPDVAVMPGVPDRARQKNLNRKIADVPVVRTMRIGTSLVTVTFTVAMSADGTETAQAFHGDPDMMHWVLSSFLLDKPLKPATEEGRRLIDANWKLGVTKCWDQVRNKTFTELGIKSIEGTTGSPYRE